MSVNPFAVVMACAMTTMALFAREQGAVGPATEKVAVAWQVKGEGRGRPVVDGPTVFFLTRAHEVVALAESTGAERWRAHTGEPGDTTFGSSLVLAGDVVVAGDDNLVAFDRATGARRWRFVPPIGYAPGMYLGAAVGGVVFAGSPAGRIYAIGAATGEQRWSTRISPNPASTVYAPDSDGRIVVTTFTVFSSPPRGGVVSLDAATGRELWRQQFPVSSDPLLGTGAGAPALIAGSVVVASAADGRVYGFDMRAGRLEWTLPAIEGIPDVLRGPLPMPPVTTSPDYRPLSTDGRLLFVGSIKGNVIAYDLATLRERWQHLDPSDGSVSLGLANDGRNVYVPFASGWQLVIDLEDGKPRGHLGEPLDGFIWRAAFSESRVFVSGRRGGFSAFHR